MLPLHLSTFRNRCRWIQEDLNFLNQLTKAYWSKTRKSCSRLWSTKAALGGAGLPSDSHVKDIFFTAHHPRGCQHVIHLIKPCIREEAERTASGSKNVSCSVETLQQLHSEPPERKSQQRLSFTKEKIYRIKIGSSTLSTNTSEEFCLELVCFLTWKCHGYGPSSHFHKSYTRGSHGQQNLGDLKESYRSSSLFKKALTSLQGKAERREVPMQSNRAEVGLEALLKPHLISLPENVFNPCWILPLKIFIARHGALISL